MKIAICGIYPPPLGGIAIHIKRCVQLLVEKGDEVIVFNQGSYHDVNKKIYSRPLKKMFFKLLFNNFDVIHFHNTNKSLKLLFSLMKLFGNKIILTSHGDSLISQIEESNFAIRFLIIANLKCLDCVICVNPLTVSKLKSLGLKRVKLIPAYIHPVEFEGDFKKIPYKVTDFIGRSNFLISANGAIRFNNGEDLYGLDLLINCMEGFKGTKVKLIFCVLNISEQSELERSYYHNLKKIIIDRGLEEQVFLFEVDDSEFYPILKLSHLFIRPTNSDGYGVSIAEAIHYNVPSIATDVCQRPEGTIIIKNRCSHSLSEKINYVLKNYDEERERIKNIHIPDCFNDVYRIYKEQRLDEK